MKVLVTGANGFIGKNLVSFLSEINDIEVTKVDVDHPLESIEEEIEDISYIFHLAGVNRPTDAKEFYDGNVGLTEKLVELLKKYNSTAPIIYASSVKAELDNDYGNSKRQAGAVIRIMVMDQ